MSLAAKLRRAPQRVVTGAFILNSGLNKLGGGDEAAKQTHGMAAGAYPFLAKAPPKTFHKGLGAAETALGAALLLPIFPAGLVGLGLVGFSGGLLTMWWRTPGMHEEGSPRPTQQGIAIAKDSWMLGIGTSLVIDSIVSDTGATRRVRRAERKANKAERKVAKVERKAGNKTNGAGARAELVGRGSDIAADAKAAAKARLEVAKKAAKAQAETAKKNAKAQTKAAKKSTKGQTKAAQVAAKPAVAAVKTAAEATRSAAESALSNARSTAESAADSASASAHKVAAKLAF